MRLLLLSRDAVAAQLAGPGVRYGEPALLPADAVGCASERQRDRWLGALPREQGPRAVLSRLRSRAVL